MHSLGQLYGCCWFGAESQHRWNRSKTMAGVKTAALDRILTSGRHFFSAVNFLSRSDLDCKQMFYHFKYKVLGHEINLFFQFI